MKHTILFDARAATEANPGISRYIRSLLTALTSELAVDEMLHVILSPDAESIPALTHPQVTVHRTTAPFETFKSHYQAFVIARSVKADIHHAPYILTPIRVPGKMVLTIHDVLPLSHPQYSTFWTRLLWRMIGRRAVRHSRKIIGVSEAALKVCEAQFGTRIAHRSRVIYHGIGASFHPQPEERVDALCETYRLPQKFFLYVGSDRPHKNVSTLLEAVALMDPTESIPLVLAGFDPKKSSLVDEAEQLKLGDRVQWLGLVPEEQLPTLYTAAHALLFPSLVESFGFPVLEAMACGTPVICSSLSVLREITGGHAKIVSACEQHEWKRAMDAAVGSLDWHDVYQKKGLARAAKFSWQTAARATLEVYRSLYRKGG